MINSDYDKLIIIKCLSGGGGKFLSACLWLGDDTIFIRKTLATGYIPGNLTSIQIQLNNKLKIEKKLKYLLLSTIQQSEEKIWNDWGIAGFWGLRENKIVEREKSEQYIYILKKIKKIIYECIDDNKFMSLVVHENNILMLILKYWKNSKVIIFENEQKFASKRNLGRHDTTYEIKTCSITKLQFDLSKYSNQVYKWDCDWYFSRDKTISEIEKLYDSFGLSGFNAEMISKFYDAWTNAIKL